MLRLASLLTLFFAALAPAHAAPVLTVYTYESFTADWGPGPAVKKAFEVKCGCEVRFVSLADGVAILNRLKVEGKNSAADIILGLDTNLTAEARNTNLFAPHGADISTVTVPNGWSDSNFLPFDFAHFAVIYDSGKIRNPPKSLDELVNGNPAEKIVIQDPRTSTPGLGLLLWMRSVYGDKAPEAWKKLSKRVLTVTPGWSEAYGLFTKGEAPMVFSYTTSPAYHMIEEKTDRYQAAAFSEGHYLQIEVAGIMASSKQPALARDFLKFMVSTEFQDIIPTTNWMMPAAKTSAPLPDAFGKLVNPSKSFLFTPEEVASKRKVWTEEWQASMAQ